MTNTRVIVYKDDISMEILHYLNYLNNNINVWHNVRFSYFLVGLVYKIINKSTEALLILIPNANRVRSSADSDYIAGKWSVGQWSVGQWSVGMSEGIPTDRRVLATEVLGTRVRLHGVTNSYRKHCRQGQRAPGIS